MKEDRIVIDGVPSNFTCRNGRFQTDISKGSPHGTSDSARGSVFGEPLVARESHTLWLEHVGDHKHGGDYYWFMWYENGYPKIPLSGVFDKEDLLNMLAMIGEFVPPFARK